MARNTSVINIDTIPRENLREHMQDILYGKLKFFNEINYGAKVSDKYGLEVTSERKGWFPFHLPYLSNIIVDEWELGMAKKGKVLELGSGTGTSSALFAMFGYDVIGIEIGEAQFRVCLNETQKMYRTFECPSKLEFFYGNYLTRDYMLSLKEGLPMNGLEQLAMDSEMIHPPFADVYKENNIKIKSYDIWFAYAWSEQMPHLLDFFQKNSGDNTMFLGVIPGYDKYHGYYPDIKDIKKKVVLRDESRSRISFGPYGR